MLGTKLILISAEISSIFCAIVLIWSICVGSIEAGEIEAAFISMFFIVTIMLQSLQQDIPWKQD